MISLWIGVYAIIFHILAYLLIIRIPIKIGNLTRQIIQGALIYLFVIPVCFVLVDDFLFWQFSAVYYFGCVAYFFITSTVYTSLSVKTLNLLIEQPNRTLSSREIFRYCILSPFEERAEIFVKDGLAEKSQNLFQITPAGRTSVKRLRWIRNLLGVDTVGFYSRE